MKIDIFSGFLGAGKTTLIKKLIKEAYVGEKLVLIENEFGEIGIDGGFMKDAGIEITEMNSGCICCSLVGDFSKALGEVYKTYNPDRIIIEPSGVGKLSDVVKAVMRADLPEVEINSCTAVVNAKKCKMYMRNFGEFFNDQIENADCIIMSHTEDISADKLKEAVSLVREHNARAEIVTTPSSQIDGKQILAAMEHTSTLKAQLEALKAEAHHHRHEHEHHHDHDEECSCGHHHHDHDEECSCGHHHHDHDEECSCGHHHHDHDEECSCGHHHHDHDEECSCGHHHHDHDEECSCGHHHHDHGHHHADEIFTSWGKETAKKFTKEELEGILARLEGDEFGDVLRAKGIVAGENGWLHFDFVPDFCEVREGGAETCGRLCVIGCGLNENGLAELFGI